MGFNKKILTFGGASHVSETDNDEKSAILFNSHLYFFFLFIWMETIDVICHSFWFEYRSRIHL
ncbi:MAG: hypothetical protein PWP28_513 [Oceanotoga sp.]|nr:hypothetical protein [Oceanotoga sp.]